MRQGGPDDPMPGLAPDIPLVGLVAFGLADRDHPGRFELLRFAGDDHVLVHDARVPKTGVGLPVAPHVVLELDEHLHRFSVPAVIALQGVKHAFTFHVTHQDDQISTGTQRLVAVVMGDVHLADERVVIRAATQVVRMRLLSPDLTGIADDVPVGIVEEDRSPRVGNSSLSTSNPECRSDCQNGIPIWRATSPVVPEPHMGSSTFCRS